MLSRSKLLLLPMDCTSAAWTLLTYPIGLVLEDSMPLTGQRVIKAQPTLQDWGDELFGALKKAGGTAYSNYAVGYNNVDVQAGTKNGIAIGNTPGAHHLLLPCCNSCASCCICSSLAAESFTLQSLCQPCQRLISKLWGRTRPIRLGYRAPYINSRTAFLPAKCPPH